MESSLINSFLTKWAIKNNDLGGEKKWVQRSSRRPSHHRISWVILEMKKQGEGQTKFWSPTTNYARYTAEDNNYVHGSQIFLIWMLICYWNWVKLDTNNKKINLLVMYRYSDMSSFSINWFSNLKPVISTNFGSFLHESLWYFTNLLIAWNYFLVSLS